jgi:hypothetical protein
VCYEEGRDRPAVRIGQPFVRVTVGESDVDYAARRETEFDQCPRRAYACRSTAAPVTPPASATPVVVEVDEIQ